MSSDPAVRWPAGRLEPGSMIDLDGEAARRWQTAPLTWRRFLLIASGAWLLLALGIGQLAAALGWHHDSGLLDAKRALLRQSHDGDILFVGTSHVLRGVIPDLVDEAMTQAGCAGRSVNLGAAGARLQDMALVIDEIAETLPPGQIVVTEGAGFRQIRPRQKLLDNQDGATIALRLRFLPEVLAGLRTNGEPSRAVLGFLLAALRNELGWHRLYEALTGAVPDNSFGSPELANTQRGFLSSEQDDPAFGADRRKRFLAQVAELGSPKGLAAAMAPLQNPGPDRAAAALALVERIEADGNRAVLLLLPARRGTSAVSARGALLLRPTLPAIDLALDQQAVPYPDPAYFFDDNHVTTLGAEVLSRQIGIGLCLLIKSGSL